MGPLLWKENPSLYWPGNPDSVLVPNYYSSEYTGNETHKNEKTDSLNGSDDEKPYKDDPNSSNDDAITKTAAPNADGPKQIDQKIQKSRQSDLAAVDALPWAHPRRIWATARMVLTYSVTRDVIGHQSKGLEDVHARAPQFDNKVEHLWTTAQICSAMIMSIAHGANDVSNAIGPFTTEYETWRSGMTSAETDTPIWIKAVGGLGLGIGFWTFGYRTLLFSMP